MNVHTVLVLEYEGLLCIIVFVHFTKFPTMCVTQDRCYREKCRYFHPPSHIKERLVSAGKQFGAMMSTYHTVQPGGGTNNPYPTNNISSVSSNR